ncbi:hypothetical protein INS49_003635 [Diaporthe citri]|uniref:uncharacterized protein n=1 Tax=Diaporthe citri TaxID=83186 RepID=UPI001C807F87|nr:uncharacterized protein INS49_003635 [Diaporthe citri]KAG6355672.1 hypothetical protein INS49_003635 [Diaporthe citri]
MTFQLGSPAGSSTASKFSGSSWGLQGITFGVNELSSSLTVANSCGSIFTRPELTKLLSAIQELYDIRVDIHPLWLQHVKFSRLSRVLGEGMRRLAVRGMMDDVEIHSLSGVATFVVLCCRYTDNERMIQEMLKLLLSGDLGTVLKFDGSVGPNLPHTMTVQLQKFVGSCLQTDMDSTVSTQAKAWMAELAHYGQVGRYGSDFEISRPQASQQLMAELLGGRSMEEHMKEYSRGLDISTEAGEAMAVASSTEIREPWARVYNTLHLSSAYIALAARANGADVVVQCFTQDGSKFFPSEPTIHHQGTIFLVRAFGSFSPLSITQYDGQRTPSRGLDGRRITIFGGTQELLAWTARALGFSCNMSIIEEPVDALSQLWRMGAAFAQRLRWVVRPQPNKLFPLRLTIEGYDKNATLPQQAIALAKSYGSREQKLKPLSRNIASIVHEFYAVDDYGPDLAQDEPEVLLAMQFIAISISVTTIRQLTHTTDDSLEQYALNLQTLEKGQQGLRDFLPSACSEGISLQQILWAAATLWGGASQLSQGSQRVTEDVHGVVAPNCTIIMDFIRDPRLFVGNGIEKMLLSVWRGAVPMLPRDPRTNFVRGNNRVSSNPTDIGRNFDRIDSAHAMRVMKGQMLLTFEPCTENPTLSVFCCWYSGCLVFEFSPACILINLLRRPMSSLAAADSKLYTYKKPKHVLKLQPGDLLRSKNLVVRDEAFVIVHGLHDPAWILFAAGCCPPTHTIIHRGPTDHLEDDVQSLINDSKISGGEVLLLVP